MNRIGIMQGRLVPMIDGKIQAFPADLWKDEFNIAKKLGFDCIEMIFDVDNLCKNPLYSEEGINKINEFIKKSGVNVYSICADYFMQKKLFGESIDKVEENLNVLKKLIEFCSLLDVKIIVIPCVDESEIKNHIEMSELISSLKKVSPLLGKIKLSLETSLEPKKFQELMMSIADENIGVNYDSGNSASLNYSPAEEIPLLSKWINHVHVKDRVRNGGTVPLGEGDTDFDGAFSELNQIGYDGIFIIQGSRGEDDVKIAKKYKAFVENYLKIKRP